MTDNRPLTPEILAAAGWEKVEETPHHIAYFKELDEAFGKTSDFPAFISVVFRKFPNGENYHVQVDTYRTLNDNIHANFRRQITVEEFNKVLELVKLEKCKIKCYQ